MEICATRPGPEIRGYGKHAWERIPLLENNIAIFEAQGHETTVRALKKELAKLKVRAAKELNWQTASSRGGEGAVAARRQNNVRS